MCVCGVWCLLSLVYLVLLALLLSCYGLNLKCFPTGSYVWKLGLQLLMVFQEALEPLGGKAYLEEVCHKGQVLGDVLSPAPSCYVLFFLIDKDVKSLWQTLLCHELHCAFPVVTAWSGVPHFWRFALCFNLAQILQGLTIPEKLPKDRHWCCNYWCSCKVHWSIYTNAQCASLLREFPYNSIHRMLPGFGLNSVSKRPRRGYGNGSAGKVADIQEWRPQFGPQAPT